MKKVAHEIFRLLLHISLTRLSLTYLQHNLNGEHCGEYDVGVGQDLRERSKSLWWFLFCHC